MTEDTAKARANARYLEKIVSSIYVAQEVVEDSMPSSREKSMVQSKLDEARLWAIEGLSK